MVMHNFISFARFILRSWRGKMVYLRYNEISIGSLTRSVHISFSVREVFSHRNIPLLPCFIKKKKKKTLRSFEH